ncbi:uncharacterized protein LOC142227917 [Haematobia irritans]|uniref:uncharacterized protein LOC142227917 n=1 Tax=Haematobia irritans TaxID=7368 RepID=UPI003F4FC285
MSSNGEQRVRRDDFDIEPIDYYCEERPKRADSNKDSRSSRSRHRDERDSSSRSRSRSGSYERRRGHGYRRGRYSYSRSRSRSHSRDYSSRRRLDSGGHRSSRSHRYRDSRSRSYSRSRSPVHYRRRHYSDRDRDYKRRSSKSRSRSRSSSYLRDSSTRRQEERAKLSGNNELRTVREENDENSKETISSQEMHSENLLDLPLPEQKKGDESSPTKPMYKFDENEPIDRARIHREMEEKLRQTLAKEGKVYPPPKPEASHPVFANDGSFLELFKKMQEQQHMQSSKPCTSKAALPTVAVNTVAPVLASAAVNPTTAPYLVATATGKSAPPPPIVGRRKGGKILKTGMVAKPKATAETTGDPKDFWSLYLAEVNKYKNTACESEQGNRPLIK